MKTVFKYAFSHPAGDVFEVPVGAQFLHAGIQAGVPCVWFEVDETQTLKYRRTFVLVGTGVRVPESSEHRGTVLQGAFVWHFYEVYD